MKASRLAWVLIITILWGCSNRDRSVELDSRCGNDPVARITLDKSRFNDPKSDVFYPDTAFVENDVLVCRLRYGGGCDYANLEILSNGTISMGIFPHIELRPAFVDDDPCEALLTADFCFDLTSLEFVSTGSEVAIVLKEWDVVLMWTK